MLKVELEMGTKMGIEHELAIWKKMVRPVLSI